LKKSLEPKVQVFVGFIGFVEFIELTQATQVTQVTQVTVALNIFPTTIVARKFDIGTFHNVELTPIRTGGSLSGFIEFIGFIGLIV